MRGELNDLAEFSVDTLIDIYAGLLDNIDDGVDVVASRARLRAVKHELERRHVTNAAWETLPWWVTSVKQK